MLAGDFVAALGAFEPLPDGLPADAPFFPGAQVDDEPEFEPRMRLGGALRARWADRAGDVAAATSTRRA